MAKPRVFVSSTYYDLRYLRSSIEAFIDSFGYEPVLSEKGHIAYAHETPLDESCYREVEHSDIYVLIIGGRYGSEASEGRLDGHSDAEKGFFERYDSVTKKEYEAAVRADIPIHILIEAAVYAEYKTFLENVDNSDVRYAHVDSQNVFRLIDVILSQPRNNPVQSFQTTADIEEWLRAQWAGRFRDLLRDKSQQRQLSSLQSQVEALSDLNVTLKRYLEEVMKGLQLPKAEDLIGAETKRLHEGIVAANDFLQYLHRTFDADPSLILAALVAAPSFEVFLGRIPGISDGARDRLAGNEHAQSETDSARVMLGLDPWHPSPMEIRFAVAEPDDAVSRVPVLRERPRRVLRSRDSRDPGHAA